MPSVSVVILTYNARAEIGSLLEAISAQTLTPAEVIVVDNASADETADFVAADFPAVTLLAQRENHDFSAGFNVGFTEASGEYVLAINSDVVPEADFVERLVGALEADEALGAVAPKIVRLSDPSIIDTMGIAVDRKHRFVNRGEGETDSGQYDGTAPFGLSGAAVCFRRSALQSIAHADPERTHPWTEFYDEQFVAYKDDVDTSYRLRHAGWELAVVPDVVLKYERSGRELKSGMVGNIRADRGAKNLRVRANSMRNHWWSLLKNEPGVNLFLLSPWILFYECAKLVFAVLTEPSTVTAAIPSFFKGLPRILRKRRQILQGSKVTASELRAFTTPS